MTERTYKDGVATCGCSISNDCGFVVFIKECDAHAGETARRLKDLMNDLAKGSLRHGATISVKP